MAYGAAATAEAVGAAQGHWNLGIYRTWYFFGGLMVAAYLGMGTAYLMLPRRAAHIIMAVLALATIYGAVRVFTASISPENLQKLLPPRRSRWCRFPFTIMPTDIEVLAPILNIAGAAFLFGGALWTAWVFWRQRSKPYRVLSNVLIAIGALAPSILTGLIWAGLYQRLLPGPVDRCGLYSGGFPSQH